MRLFPRLDLVLVLLANLLAAALTLSHAPVLFRLYPGLLAVLFLPGYSLSSAVFPRDSDVDRYERIALAIGLSLVTVALLALALAATPWGVRRLPITLSLTAITIVATVGAWFRGSRIALDATATSRGAPVSSRSATGYRVAWGTPGDRWPPRGWRLPALIATTAAMVAALALLPALRAPSQLPTDFYVLGTQGLVRDYPVALLPNSPLVVQVGLVNHDAVSRRYRIVAMVGPATVADSGTFGVAAGSPWAGTVRIAPSQATGEQRIDLLLLRGSVSTPYRRLRLWVNVPANGNAG